MARPIVPGQGNADRHDDQDQGAQRHQARPRARLQDGHRFRSERAVQEGVRRGVRHLRRRAVRHADRRFRRHAPAGRRVLHRADVARGRGRARAVHRLVVAGAVRPGIVCRPGQAARPGQGVRYGRVRQVEVVPRVGGFALRGPDDAALPGPAAVQPHGRHHRRGLQLRRRRGRHRPQQIPVVQRRLGVRCAADRRVRRLRLVRGDPRGGRRRAGRRPADAYLQDRRRRDRAQVPDGNRHHRPAREGAERPGLHPARALQELGLCRVLRGAVGAETQEVRHRQCERQRGAVGAAAVHLLGIARGALPEGDDARQDRQLRVGQERRDFPQPVDLAVRPAGRQRDPGAEGAVSAARSLDPGVRSARQARYVPLGGVPAAALPAR